jgi:hypothetical protein
MTRSKSIVRTFRFIACLLACWLATATITTSQTRQPRVDAPLVRNQVESRTFAISLPKMSTSPSDRAAAYPTKLTTLSGRELKPESIELYTAFADTGENSYQLKSPAAGTWDIFLAPQGKPDPLVPPSVFKAPLASLIATSRDLMFRWNLKNVTPHSAQLANSIIDLKDDGSTKRIALREPDRLAVVVLDLSTPVQTFDLPIENLPPAELLTLRLNASQCPEPNFGPAGAKTSSPGEPLKLSREDKIQTELELEIVTRPKGAELQLTSYYTNADGRRTQLNAKNIKSNLIRQQKLLQKAQGTFNAAQNAIPQLENQLQAERAKVPRNVAEARQLRISVDSIKNQLKRAQGTVQRFARSGPKLQNSVATLEALAEEGNDLHQNARLHLSVIAKKADRELELATFGGPDDPTSRSSSGGR